MASAYDLALPGEAQRRLQEETRFLAEARLNELMLTYQGPIFRFLSVVLQDRDTALDCTQETFVRAYEHLRRGRLLNASWLYKVARSRAMNEIQRRKRFEPWTEASDTAAVDHRVDRRVAVRHTLAKLSPQDRRVLYLCDVAGFPATEAAVIVNVEAPALRQRLRRARNRFRRLYGEAG